MQRKDIFKHIQINYNKKIKQTNMLIDQIILNRAHT